MSNLSLLTIEYASRKDTDQSLRIDTLTDRNPWTAFCHCYAATESVMIPISAYSNNGFVTRNLIYRLM